MPLCGSLLNGRPGSVNSLPQRAYSPCDGSAKYFFGDWSSSGDWDASHVRDVLGMHDQYLSKIVMRLRGSGPKDAAR